MDIETVLQDIINDGYLSESNVARAREALAAVRPGEKLVNRTLVAKWLGFTAPHLREKFVEEFK